MTRQLLSAASAAALFAGAAHAQGTEQNFNRIASFPVALNAPEGSGDAMTSSEIIAATADGMTLVYTDSPAMTVGFIGIEDPASPEALGRIDLQGEPTSVAVVGQTAYVAVNTSEDYVNTSGELLTIDVATQEIVSRCDLGGQPDSIAASGDGAFLSIAIENERDEDLDDGVLPQMPAGYLSMIDIGETGAECDSLTEVDLTGLAEVGPSDPEPEFVDINEDGETVVSLQENNHLVIVSRDGEIVADFTAGSTDLEGIDTEDDGALVFDGAQDERRREPDTIAWIGTDYIATADEGDYEGGSRGWTVFNRDGTVAWEAGASFEHAAVMVGHYPDKRSDAKGVEPESVEIGTFGDLPMAFVGSERGSVVGVYDITDPEAPVLRQMLPSGIGPEGLLAIPSRGLLVTANEEDLIEDGGARSHVMIYELQDGPAAYPHITSEGMDELTGWGALSGLAAVDDSTLVAISDSFYGLEPKIFTIDVSQTPARITDAMLVTRGGDAAQKLDLEGIALDGEGGYWLASEGRTERAIPHAIYHVDAGGEIDREIGLPEELSHVEKRFGFEGITMLDGRLWMAVQREWADDAKGEVKLVAYDPENGEWGGVRYPLETPETGWIGLSEIVAGGEWVYLIERDNQLGQSAAVKQITRVAAEAFEPAPLGGELPLVEKEVVRDLIPDLLATNGYVQDKVEGLAITEGGTMWIVTDNDGVDDSSGETMLWSVPRD
ncbi:esterase-like activity of phytase family protein [Tropicimonas sp. IMCC34011]|uniref:esterase-like activity of phytase family protein n=1 Tax=Tropicimonas sp. IMCC34011 TaxID=2248759 RepID=UPI000E241DC8|nr:esterase-like activity of phytase family protein [Tropicimonas sp. IMCC34011]